MSILARRQRLFVPASGYNDASLPEALRNQPRLMKPYSGDQLECELERMFMACGGGN